MSDWEQWLTDEAVRRDAAGLTRRLRPRGPDDDVDRPRRQRLPRAVARPARRRRGRRGRPRLGCRGRVPPGSSPARSSLHETLEQELAAFLGQPAALAMSTGYHANLAAVTALADRDTLIVSDAHIHASLIDAARLSRAEIAVTPARRRRRGVARRWPRAGGRRAIVLAESIYSVLGDAAPLTELADVCAAHDALLIVDEAHGLGVAGAIGEGLVRDSASPPPRT